MEEAEPAVGYAAAIDERLDVSMLFLGWRVKLAEDGFRVGSFAWYETVIIVGEGAKPTPVARVVRDPSEDWLLPVVVCKSPSVDEARRITRIAIAEAALATCMDIVHNYSK
jgi:hypothetical protein